MQAIQRSARLGLILVTLALATPWTGRSSADDGAFRCGEWIAPPAAAAQGTPVFRKEFRVAELPETAMLRVIGLGDYDLQVNGKRLSAIGINQPWSQYEKTIYYRDFDIRPLIKQGDNCLGVVLGNSFWHNPNPPAGRYNKDGPQRAEDEPFLLRAEAVLSAQDGSMKCIGTDASWRVTGGPIIFSHIFAGEDFDARRELGDWSTAGFDDRAWGLARIAKGPNSQLAPQTWPPIQPQERFQPVSIKQVEPKTFLFSFPQNCSAQLHMELSGGKSGDVVSLRCGEHKNSADRLFGGYVVGCSVTTRGASLDYQWLFYYLGMQFVEVSGAVPEGHPNPDHLPVIRRMELIHVRAALAEVGQFRCSSELFQSTHRLIDWAIRSNASYVLTDCPHREKLGWLECSYLLAPSISYRYDCRDWTSKVLRDIRDAQEPSGRVPTVAPSYPKGRFPGAFDWTVEWGAAAALLPWHHYQWYGDPQTLRDNFDMMRRFTDYVGTQASDGLAPAGLGDWYDYGHGQPPGPSRFTPTTLSATATWAMCATAVARAAEALGQADLAKQYGELHSRIAADFLRHFQNPESRLMKHQGSPQCANSMALRADLVPQADRGLLVQDIIADLRHRGWQQTPGDVGHVHFIRAMAEAGKSDALHRVYSRTGVGSYGGILAKGLTALPETWDAMMDGGQSLNHCMLGHVLEWYYGYVAGIRQASDSVGWKHIVIGPNPGPLDSAEASLQTPAGRITSRWTKKQGGFHLEVDSPPGLPAVVVLPSGKRISFDGGHGTFDEPWSEPDQR